MGLDSVAEESYRIRRSHPSPVHDQRQGVPDRMQVNPPDTGSPAQDREPI